MFLECIELLQEGNKEELFKWCFSRSSSAFDEIYEYEQARNISFWRIDERFYEQGIEVLYERFCYAMAIIADRFYKECSELYGEKEAQDKCETFAIFLNGCAVEVFKRGTRDMGWPDTTMEYYMEDYLDEAYDDFWDEHENLRSDIIALRNDFAPEERTYLHGFGDSDEENTDDEDDEQHWATYNRDFLHIMRICSKSSDIDVDKFLGSTKRHYLPTIIKAFMVAPKRDVFAVKPPAKWWQLWKR